MSGHTEDQRQSRQWHTRSPEAPPRGEDRPRFGDQAPPAGRADAAARELGRLYRRARERARRRQAQLRSQLARAAAQWWREFR